MRCTSGTERRTAAAAALLLALGMALAGCGSSGREARETDSADTTALLTIRFDDVEVPEILDTFETAHPAATEDGAGLWAAVPGLARPERGLVSRSDGAAAVVVALYRAAPGAGLTLSAEAAAALDLTAAEEVRVVALRAEPSLDEGALGGR